MNSLRHRGPDDEGLWISASKRTGLGHRRLSVIDLDTGAQPITNEDGTIAVIVNGEFYGFEQIRKHLESKGHRFSTKSDSEILVHLYEEKGEACVEDLRGEFAFVLFDEKNNKLFAARDRFGIKPLFYTQSNGDLILGSEAKALFAAGVIPRWDQQSVISSLFLCLSPDQSLFDGINQIPPGHTLTSRNGTPALNRYWDADYPLASASSDDDEHTCVQRTSELLDEAIRLRMRADVPIGCLLSGGLDSSSILGLASRMSDITMRAFTISFDDPAFDESGLARETARYTFTDFEAVDASKMSLADHFEDSVAQGEIVQYNAHGTARYLLSRAVQRAGYKVVLAGEGADELFGGYGFASTAILSKPKRWSAILRLLKPLNNAEKEIRRTSPWLVRTARLLNLNPEMIDPLSRRMGLMRSILSRDVERDPYLTFFDKLAPIPAISGREPAKQLIYLWMKSIFPSYVLSADRADMAHGLEVRLPFLDHVLFDYVKTIPASILAAKGERKHVLREVARDVIPSEVRNRVKKPLMAPAFTKREDDPLNCLVSDIISSNSMQSVPFFNTKTLRETRDDPILLMAASLCIIQDRYHVT